MRNILFDLYTPQLCFGGASEYIRKVFYSLVETVSAQSADVRVLALFDEFSKGSKYTDLTPENVRKMGVETVELKGQSLKTIVEQYDINKVFIGAAQYWAMYLDIESIPCEVVCVVHDLMDEEFANSHMKEYLLLGQAYKFIHFELGELWRKWSHKKEGLERMKPVIRLYENNKKCQMVVVSDYTKTTVAYNFDIPSDRIHVLYSPARVCLLSDKIDNPYLENFIKSGKRYYLMLNANRYTKNPRKAISAFKRYTQTVEGRDAYLVSLGYKQQEFENHVILPYLSDNDLVAIMQHCYALIFPSVFEGFGYPPLEAMGYGKPVMSSNVTSMPEVLGDAALYFSPVYESDMFRCLLTLNDTNYKDYSQKSKARFAEVTARQEKDLACLIEMIIK